MTYRSQPHLISVKPLFGRAASHSLLGLPNDGGQLMQAFITHMRIQKLSDATIQKRIELLHRLGEFLDCPLPDATTEKLMAFQATYSHLAPASMHIYTRHITAYYRWAKATKLLDEDPAADLELPRLRKTQPHPTKPNDIRTIFSCARGRLRTAYMLAAFAGLRSGEICRLRSNDINYEDCSALIHGKGGKERTVPLLKPVMDEVGYRRGWIVTRDDGTPVEPVWLSGESTRFMKNIGVQSTLHSMRAAFATNAVRMTHDPLLVRDLLGHESVATTEIYMETNLDGVHDRLQGMVGMAEDLLRPRRLVAVS